MSKLKDAKCVECGKDIQIHIYASAKKCKCDDCKRGIAKHVAQLSQTLNPGEFFQGDSGPRIDGRPNRALEKLCCPYHHDIPMKVIGVIRSEGWGDLVTLQCRRPGCWVVVNISEQTKGPLRTKSHGDGFEPDMDPEEIKRLLAEGKLSEAWLKQVEKM